MSGVHPELTERAKADAFVVLHEDPFGRTATEMARHVEALVAALVVSEQQQKRLREAVSEELAKYLFGPSMVKRFWEDVDRALSPSTPEENSE